MALYIHSSLWFLSLPFPYLVFTNPIYFATCRGHKVRSVTVCGGLTASPLYLQTQADVLGLPLLVPQVLASGCVVAHWSFLVHQTSEATVPGSKL